MHQLDTTDILLIIVALVALGGHLLYSQYKKIRDRDLERSRKQEQPEQPQVWGKMDDDTNG